MKPNHSSGRALAVEGVPDWTMVKEAAHSWLAPSRFRGLHWIWPYDIAESGLLAEVYIPNQGPPIEWQVWIIGGRIQYVVVQQRLGSIPKRSVFDHDWKAVAPWYNRDAAPMRIEVPPINWGNIEHIALAIGVGWDMIRVDLFEDQRGGIWFSELTPYPSEGLFSNRDGMETFDLKTGDAWKLPSLLK